MDINKVQQFQADILRKKIALEKKQISQSVYTSYLNKKVISLKHPSYSGLRRPLKKILFKLR